MTDKKLPDSYADNPAAFDESVENLAGSPIGPQLLSESLQKDQYIAELEILHRQRDVYQGEVDPQEMNEYLQANQQEELDNFIYSAHGREYTMRKLAEDGQKINEEQSGRSSEDYYRETFAQRKQREYNEEQARKGEGE